jgi:hypothetical protein
MTGVDVGQRGHPDSTTYRNAPCFKVIIHVLIKEMVIESVCPLQTSDNVESGALAWGIEFNCLSQLITEYRMLSLLKVLVPVIIYKIYYKAEKITVKIE